MTDRQPITSFDRETLRALRPEIDAALAQVAARHGLRVRVGNARFTDTTADVKLELVVDRPAAPGSMVPESREAAAFRLHAPLYGFRADQLGATFRYEGDVYRIIGLRPNAPKRPILIASTTNPARRVVAPPEMILGLLARAAA